MQSTATTVASYLASLPEDRRSALQAIRTLFKQHADPTFEEGMQYGMIGYYVPHSVFPPGYHCNPKEPLPFAGLASQKQHLSLYLMCLYADSKLLADFVADYTKSGKKLDMGKACLRFKTLDDLHLPALTKLLQTITAQAYISHYQSLLSTPRTPPKPTPKKSSTTETRSTQSTTKKTPKPKAQKNPPAKTTTTTKSKSTKK